MCEIVHGDNILWKRTNWIMIETSARVEYPLISKAALLISVPFVSTNFCEIDFHKSK